MTRANRVILLTPPGSAAIAVLRLLGPAVVGFLRAHFSRPLSPSRPVHGRLFDGPRTLDDPVVVLGLDSSFADVNIHGGPWVIRSVLDLLARSGFETVETAPIPLPADAVDADTPLEREVLTHLPLGKTDLALRVLLSQPDAWRRFIHDAPTRPDLPDAITSILADRSLHWLLNAPRVAIVGAPNVGKSSLANQLFAQERSITADLPGTTRDWVGEMANLDGLAVMLVDTPGLRPTQDAIERQAIDHSADQIRQADLILLVLDVTQPLEPQSALARPHPASQLIINKCDQPPAWDTLEQCSARCSGRTGLGGTGILPVSAAQPTGKMPVPQLARYRDSGFALALPAIHTSALTGQGIDHLRVAIRAHFDCETLDPTRPRWWTDRQRRVLQRATKTPHLAPRLLLSEFLPLAPGN